MDAISVNPENMDQDDPVSVYSHIEFIGAPEGLPNMVSTLCGAQFHEDNALWYEGLKSVDCPLCLRIVAIGKAATIRKSRLPSIT